VWPKLKNPVNTEFLWLRDNALKENDMANFPTATLTINFSTAVVGVDDALLVAEVASEDNDGQTSFTFDGPSPKFRVYKSPNISQVRFFPSVGSVGAAGSGSAQFTEEVQFAGFGAVSDGGARDDSYRRSNVAKPVTGAYDTLFSVGNIGSVSLIEAGFNVFQCSAQSQDPLNPIVGLARIRYNSSFTRHSLSGVSKPPGFGQDGFDRYSVIVFIVGVIG